MKKQSIFEKGFDLLARPFTCLINPESHVNLHNVHSSLVDNSIIQEPVKNKPHITLVHGYWRLSNACDSCLYHKTHAFIYNLNSVIHHEKSKISKL
jgi:hypothetical protein